MEENTAIQLLQLDGEILVDSRIVAKGIGVTHKAFMETLRTYQSELEEFGILRFETAKPQEVSAFETAKPQEKKVGGRPETYAKLNRNQSGVAISFSRNTKEVVRFKVDLFKAIDQLEQKIIPAMQQEILQLRERAQLLLPERVTDKQAIEVLGQLQAMVRKEELATEIDDVKRHDLEFALKKAGAYFQGQRLQTFNLRDKPNQWGEVRIKEYPDETEEEREYLRNKAHSIREKQKTQDEKRIEELILEHLDMYFLETADGLLDATDANPAVFKKVLKSLVRAKVLKEQQKGKTFWYSVTEQGE